MSVQIPLGAPATRVASRKLGPVAGSRSPPASSASAAWETSTFASTWGRWETVARIASCVWGSIATGLALSPCRQPVQPLVEDARGRWARRQVPGRALEKIRPRVFGAGVLGPRQRMAADEPRVVVRGDDRPLRRADVGHDAVARRGRERLADGSPEARQPAPPRTLPRRPRPHRRTVPAIRSTKPRARAVSSADAETSKPATVASSAREQRARSRRRSARRRRRRSSNGRARERLARHALPPPGPVPDSRRTRRPPAAAGRRRSPPRAAGGPRR